MKQALMLLTLTVLVLTGCGQAPSAEQPGAPGEWALTIVVGQNTTEMSFEQIRAFSGREVDFLSKETGTTNLYRGVSLGELCQAAGADLSTIQSVEVEAEDGFLAVVSREMVSREGVYLVVEMDGGPLPEEMGRVRMLAPGEATKYQVKQVKRVLVK